MHLVTGEQGARLGVVVELTVRGSDWLVRARPTGGILQAGNHVVPHKKMKKKRVPGMSWDPVRQQTFSLLP